MLKPNSRKMGTLSTKSLRRNLVWLLKMVQRNIRSPKRSKVVEFCAIFGSSA